MKTKKKIIVAATLAAISSLAFGAVGVFANAAGKEKGNTKINYEIAPQITVEFPNGFNNELPNAVLNKGYAIPSATATDVYGDELTVSKALYVHYYSETRSFIQIENNAFIPTFYGVYTLCYTATDSFGNVATEIFDITCQPKDAFTATVAQASGEYSVGREVKVADIQMQNAIGETSVAITAICAQTKYTVENGVFVPEYAGEYTIEYLCADYSETCKTSYNITVAENDMPIFLSDISMPEYFIVGAPYKLPTAKCRVYRNNAMFDVVPAIEVYYSSLNQRVTIKDGEFTPTAQGDITIKYTASAYGKTVTKEFLAKSVDVNFNGAMDMSKYFVGENVGVQTLSYGVSINTLTDGAGVDFINPVLSQELSMLVGIDSDKNDFSSLDIYLTDSVDKDVQIKLSFVKEGESAKFVVNNDDYAFANVGFKNASNLDFAYSNDTKIASMGGSDNIFIDKTLSGAEFNGFESTFINIRFELNGVKDYSTCYVYSIDNQTFSNESGDGMRPYILFTPYTKGERQIGDVIHLERVYVSDILDPNYTVSYYVLTPSGAFAKSIDGELLDMDTDYTKEVSFIAAENGRYDVYMEVTDSVGNGELYAYSVEVVNKDGAKITLSNVKTTVKAGSQITLAKASVTDNLTPSEELEIHVIICTPSWTMETVKNGQKYTPKQYGTYTVYYYVTDSDGNITMESYQFTVQ